MPKFIDETGNVYGKLTVLRRVNVVGDKRGAIWLCQCSCGGTKETRQWKLRAGKVRSCGCLHREVTVTHGLANTPVYACWQQMLQRCFNPKRKAYPDYGGRGITVCDRWNPAEGGSFENFLEDMGECPEGLTLDRIDVDGNYCKENCRWVNSSMQVYNTRKKSNNTSGRTGVSFSKQRGKWEAYISVKGEFIRLGYFSDFEEACAIRSEAELKYYGKNKE